MKNIALKLMLCLAAMPLSLFCLGLTHNDWFFLGFVVSLPFAILYWIDLGQELRDSSDRSPLFRVLGILMGVPQALFGLVCTGVGLSMVGWVLYNTFIDRQPEYSGGFLTFGVGPGLVLFGLLWLVTAFRRAPDKA